MNYFERWKLCVRDLYLSSGLSPTQYQYTGQYSHTAMYYCEASLWDNARWYDPALGRFAQADSIVPPGVQGLDRYAYVNNNPMRYTDPSGHRCAGGGDEDINGYCLSPASSTIASLNQYGVTIVGNATQQQQSYILAGVRQVANALSRELGKNPREAFKLTYGISPDDPFKFVFGSCDPRDGRGGCANKDGQKAGAYTWSSREVEFFIGQPFYKAGGNHSSSEAYGMSVHTVVHELGHAFDNRFNSKLPSTMIGTATFREGDAYTTNLGFRDSPDPISASDYWRPNSSTEAGETFANMFLGWAYGAWDNDTYGTQRGNYMTTHMADTWLPILTGK